MVEVAAVNQHKLAPVRVCQMDEERRHRVYALNSESKGSSVPDMMMVTPPARLPPSGQANGDAAAAGTANEDAAGGSALGAALAAATAAVNAALRNAPAAQQGLGQGGAAAGGEAIYCCGDVFSVFWWQGRMKNMLNVSSFRPPRYVLEVNSKIKYACDTGPTQRSLVTAQHASDMLTTTTRLLKFTALFSLPAVEDANQVAPANGGDGEAVGGTEGNENVAHPAPDALDPMEDLLIDEVGFMDDAYEEEDEDDFIDEEVSSNAWGALTGDVRFFGGTYHASHSMHPSGTCACACITLT